MRFSSRAEESLIPLIYIFMTFELVLQCKSWYECVFTELNILSCVWLSFSSPRVQQYVHSFMLHNVYFLVFQVFSTATIGMHRWVIALFICRDIQVCILSTLWLCSLCSQVAVRSSYLYCWGSPFSHLFMLRNCFFFILVTVSNKD